MAEAESKRGPGNEDVKFFVFVFSRRCPLSDFSTLTGETIFGRIILTERVDFWPKKRLSLG